MQLSVKEYQLPEQILFNYEELKQELTEKVSMYETMVYTDDQIKMAKSDKASLNKLKKALNDERIRREKEYLAPFNEFKAQINEIIGIIDKPIQIIDKQVKAFDEQKKAEKLEEIKEFWESIEHPEWLTCNQIFEQRWLNVSVAMSKVKKEIAEKLNDIDDSMQMLSNLPEFGFEAVEVYKTTLNVSKAVDEAQRMAEIAKAKAEQEKLKEESKPIPTVGQVIESVERQAFEQATPTEPQRTWLTFRANLTTEDAFALKAFFESRNIEFERA